MLSKSRQLLAAGEEARSTLLHQYNQQKKSCAKNITEMRDWEAKVVDELKNQEKNLMKSERSDFANVLVCKALEAGIGGHGGGAGGEDGGSGGKKEDKK